MEGLEEVTTTDEASEGIELTGTTVVSGGQYVMVIVTTS
jgi:hypothetical protein